MSKVILLVFLIILLVVNKEISGQTTDSSIIITAVACGEQGIPLQGAHIINISSGRGTTSGSDGRFSIKVLQADSLIIRNIGYYDTLIMAEKFIYEDTIFLAVKIYEISEIRIFEWGTSYADFRAKMKSMEVPESPGKKLGLLQQSGHPVPNFRNSQILSSPAFAISNPVDFQYFNLSKKEKSIRNVMEFESNEPLIRRFESVYNREKIMEITGLKGEELDAFMIYMNKEFRCSIHCTELQIITEIYSHWEYYRNWKEQQQEIERE